MALRPAAFIILLSSWLGVGATVAQDRAVDIVEHVPRVVIVTSDECDAVPHDELHKLIALELAPRTVRSTDSTPEASALTHATVRCSDTEARLSAREAIPGRHQALTLDLTEIPAEARARLLALTLSELVATVELESTPRGPVAGPRDDSATRHATHAPVLDTSRAWLGAGIARAGRPAMLFPSLQAGITATFARWPLALQSDLQLHGGRRAVSDGDVVSWAASGSAGAGVRLANAWVEGTLGLGLRLGYAHLQGDAGTDESVAGRSVSGMWWGPTAFVGALLPARSRWGVRCGLDLTYVARDVRGLNSAGGTSYSIEGLQLQANLGVSLKLAERRVARE